MKKYLLISFFVLPSLSDAQTVVLSDNFDSYAAGNPLAATSALWTTWTGAATEDANVSSTQSFSAPNSVYIIGNTGPTDLVLPFPSNYTSGVYDFDMKIFIVTGKGAYFNLQGSMTPGVEWMLEVYFDNAGGGSVNAGGPANATFTYNPNTWNTIKVHVDLSGDVAQLFVNTNLICTWAWSLGSDGTGAPIMWGGLNLYAAASAPGDAEFYVDDVTLTDVALTGMEDTFFFSDMKLHPNPSAGNMELQFSSNYVSKLTLQIFNSAGEKIMEKNERISIGKNRISFSELSLSSGIYFVRMFSEGRMISKKFIIEKQLE